ncbi:T9SS type A sorting domain-containing protein [Cesiribacter sp. SM1]|uniref:T9SS type A sorting domain-containing protein n=1 Tax=Cesiribacter sp. SM1 TaxID=2861196 RepID=UPI001CD6C6E0|nr:T9SS type A sorting domain-containing protein [Cesiribacter sp. SM1]
MRKHYLNLFLLLFLFSLPVFAQKESKDNYFGDWSTATSWKLGPAPGMNFTENVTITSTAYITAKGDLSVSGNNTLIVQGILVVEGSLTLGGSAKISIASNAILIVLGDFTASGSVDIGNAGIIAVQKAFTANDAAIRIAPGDETYLYTNPILNDNTKVNGSKCDEACQSSTFKDEEDLKNAHLDIWQFINRNGVSPLPVELLYFRSTTTNQGIQLEWASAKEWNFSHYTIERSTDGKEFTPIHKEYVSGDSHSNKAYLYLDMQPHFGANFYRLKATDVDGTTENKGMALVYSGMKGNLQLYPNPSNGGMLTIKNPGAIEGTWLSITSTTGNELMRIQMPKQELRLPASVLTSGVYLVKVWNQLEVKQARLIVQ